MDRQLSRRRFLALGGASAGAVLLAACSGSKSSERIAATAAEVGAREQQRAASSGAVRTFDVAAREYELDLAGRVVKTRGYGSTVPGPEVRVRAGDTLELRLQNQLREPTTVHWHGLAIRNDMDGVPDMTQLAIKPGESFTYRFVVPDPGTYWFHPHMGLDLDRGMYAPLIVEDPADPGGHDAEAILMFDDWLDGIDGATPEGTFERLKGSGGMGAGGMGGMSGMDHDMGSGGTGMAGMSDWGDVDYPLHLVNGRPPADPVTVTVAPDARVRLRMINAGSDTVYRIAVGRQPMLVTHLDGFPIEPVEVDTVLLSMGERVDATVRVPSGLWPVVALAEGKTGAALAWLRSTDTSASTPEAPSRLAGHDGRLLDPAAARAAAAVAFEPRQPERTVEVDLSGGMMSYNWGIDGRSFDEFRPIEVNQGERVRLRLRNRSMMVHPMHLHGHTFAFAGEGGARKDTVLVRPMESLAIDVVADNPGQWMFHCHNTYHLEAGMATVLSYVQ